MYLLYMCDSCLEALVFDDCDRCGVTYVGGVMYVCKVGAFPEHMAQGQLMPFYGITIIDNDKPVIPLLFNTLVCTN